MRRFVISTDDVPEAERFSYWRETVSRGLFGTSPEPPRRREDPFNARIEAMIGGPVAYAWYRCSPYSVRRERQDIARVGWEGYAMVYRGRGAGAWVNYGGTELWARPGDIYVLDTTVPLRTESHVEFNEDVMFVPRTMIEPHLPQSGLRRILALEGGGGVAALAKSYFDAFVRQMSSLDERELVSVTDHFCRLLAMAGGAAAGDHGEAIRSARLDAVKRYVDLNLADPELRPEKAARALNMSERRLHLVFEPSGTTFSRYVLRRRLEECRAALIANPARPVTDIAFGWGFNSLASFYRAFQAAFGVAPRDVREAQRAASPFAGCANRMAAE